MKSVDVVVLSWNRAKDTLDCLDSILSQEGVELTVWIVDQGSSPEYLQSLRERCHHPAVNLIELGENIGVPAGRNRGMRAGVAPLIVCLDNDAVFRDSQVIKRACEAFHQDPELGALGFAIYDSKTGGPDTGSWGYPFPVEDYFLTPFLAARFCGAGHAIRRTAFEKTNGYDERLFFFAEELDLSYQLIAQGYVTAYDPDLAVDHRLNQEARVDWNRGRYYYNVRNMVYLNFKHFRDPWQLFVYSMGYLLKGVLNRQTRASLRGLLDAFRLVWRHHRTMVPLSQRARSYIEEHETRPRGSLWSRCKREVLVKLGKR